MNVWFKSVRRPRTSHGLVLFKSALVLKEGTKGRFNVNYAYITGPILTLNYISTAFRHNPETSRRRPREVKK